MAEAKAGTIVKPVRDTLADEAIALDIAPLQDLTVLSRLAWAIALSLATVPLVLTQFVWIWRVRGPALNARRRADNGAATR